MSTQRTWTGHVFIATSVDGLIALPDGGLDWLTDPPPEPGHVAAHSGDHDPPGYEDFTADVTHLVMGRGTYDKVTAFLAADLVDELTITRAPVVLGAGTPLFHALPRPVRLVHLGTSTTQDGTTSTRYRVDHARGG